MIITYPFKTQGKEVQVFEPVRFIGAEHISVGNFVRISEFVLLNGGQGLYLGNFIHIANHSSIIGGGICVVEDFVGICAGARIITGSDDFSGSGIPSPLVPAEYRSNYRSFVKLGKHSFIGTNAVIHPGVTIAEGCVIGSGSVVTKSTEPWSIYHGSPAKKVKDRPREEIQLKEQKTYVETNVRPSDFSAIQLG